MILLSSSSYEKKSLKAHHHIYTLLYEEIKSLPIISIDDKNSRLRDF